MTVAQTAVWICHADSLCLRMRWMRHHNWQSLLLRASKSSSSDAAIVVSVRHLFLQPELQQMHLRNY